jgi:hypothetical protein
MTWRDGLWTVVLVSVVGSLAAQELPPLPATSPVWTGFSRPEGLELVDPESGWQVAGAMTYGNTFLVSDGVLAAHQLFGGADAELGLNAWSAARSAEPDADLWALDTETVRWDLEAQRGLSDGWSVGFRATLLSHRGTGIDSLPRWWHDLIGVGDGGRNLVADGGSFSAVAGSAGGLAESGETTRFGPVTAWVGHRWGDAGRGHRISGAVAAATGSGGLAGDGWSVGVRWHGWQRWSRWSLSGGAGWTEHTGSLVGERSATATGHLWFGGAWHVGEQWALEGLVRGDQSPWRDLVDAGPGEATGEMAFGLRWDHSEDWRIQASFIEDVPGSGAAPDFAVAIRVTHRSGG